MTAGALGLKELRGEKKSRFVGKNLGSWGKNLGSWGKNLGSWGKK